MTRRSSSVTLPPAEVEENPLTADVMVASLDFLTHNAMGYLVYAVSNLSSRCLTSIEMLGTYKYLQRISLNDNMLDSLKPLRELHGLVYLSAAGNKLTNEVFDDLAPSGTTLERLNLDRNCLTSLRGLHQLPFLVDFCAEENQLEELANEELSSLHSLTRLDLMSNRIRRIQLNTFATCDTVRSINLSHNEVEKVQFVMHLANSLEKLDLGYNKIKNLDGFDVLQELVDLQLVNNEIESWTELETLSGLINLRHLTIEGNPILQESEDTFVCKSLPGYAESKVESDVDFSARKFCGGLLSSGAADAGNTLLSSLVVPCARAFVKEATLMPRRLEEWDEDGLRELLKLPLSEQRRFRVISILQQLTTIDSIPVSPNDIPRALRLFKKKSGKRFPVGGNFFPVGSAARVVESQRAKNGAATL
ncbi:leucine-richcontaining protein 23 [Trypanosoma rangeli]|uniref:Leucine-richcontaining protein 23 n=1 Tax=Trypanosoma rangeli TaxID=5698 RepID=A0A422NCV4_TRYRA|nr:leucine-richcontaining protein 23 [Trypanosoma rangeli]RNF03266.1 leucine-richcontaining protein 23 [Trypanosoma rangeli]|eukprot:RNF03266.1 leucine-richcontaining protein 23 [Trypanosoma rangeli]